MTVHITARPSCVARWFGPAATACICMTVASASAQDLCFSATPYDVGAEPSDVKLADLNGDGALDMAVADHAVLLDNRVAILINNGDGTFAPSVFYDVGERPYWLAAGDLNADGFVDLAVTNYHGLSVSILINAGDGTFLPHQLLPVGAGPTFLAIGAFDLNDSPDLVVANAFDSTISILLNNGDGTFAEQVAYPVENLPYGVSAADLDGDSYMDVAVSNYGAGEVNTPISVLHNNGDGTFAPHVTYPAGIATVGIATADLDNDGDREIVTADSGFVAEGTNVSVLMNNGDGTFAAGVSYGVGTGPYSVTVTDFNADGFADIASANEDGTVSVLMNAGDGTFAASSTFPIIRGAQALGIDVGDLDGNGTPEIAVACYAINSVAVLYNAYVGFPLQPADVAVTIGGTANFTVVATGPGPFSYQWRRDGVELADDRSTSGATTDSLTIEPVTALHAGLYDVVITNDCASSMSAAATLTVKSSCIADLTADGHVNGADLAVLLGSWGTTGAADFDNSGIVNGADLAVLLGSWGPC